MKTVDCFANGFVAGGVIASALWIFLILKGLQWYRSSSFYNPAGQGDSPRASQVPSPHSDARHAEMISYRSRNGRSNYRFQIRQMGPRRYRVYVISQPGYGSRDAGDHATHRLGANGDKYICFTGRIETAAQARTLAATWADNTEDYILHGRRF